MNIQDKVKCKVPFGTVSIQPESKQLINTFLATGMVTNGKCVREFENEFAKKFGVRNAVAVSSGTDADTLALASMYHLGAERGDEVIIPALTFVATANSVINAGFKPTFVDVDLNTLNLEFSYLDRYITSRTRVIMPVHLMGKPADMDPILDIANRHELNVIEDAAEAHGAQYKGKLVGTIAPAGGCFSLYAAHIITAIEGGMITVDNDELAIVLRSLRNHGLQLRGSDWTFERIGFSSKMNELEAAVGLGNLGVFEQIIGKRRNNFFYLRKGFLKFSDYFYTISEQPHERISPHAFPIIMHRTCPFTKAQFVNFLNEKGIDNRNLFYSIPTQCKSYQYLGYKRGCFPNAEYLSDYGTHIGIHQDLTYGQLDYVLECLGEFIQKHG